MNKSIAVIGISFELPGIKNWSELSQSLKNKETSIGALSSERLQDIHNQFGPVEMGIGSFLKRIDLFDNEYFNVTEREATKMFPEHRFFMSYALRAFYDAGYTENDIKQSNTGIFFSTASSQYTNFLGGQYDFFDALPGIEATRLANFLDLRGPVVSVNTTCSSSLVSIHNACSALKQEECNMAIVGGVKLGAISKERAENFVVISNKGECRPFDKDADGMLNGEGIIFMVLKRLEDAEKDKDTIYATIEGSAINHGGARISSLTAPSVEAQKDVIIKAWENAKINPKDIKFIEAHGTGTILGDPIEFSGINEAFTEKEIVKSNCKISSIKAQIGHLDTMSGMAGLLRLIVALNSKIIPAQANFTTPNEHIDEEDSVIKVQRESEYWESNNGKRIGGVSSYGLTGTNIHMVLSHQEKNPLPVSNSQINFIQLSENTKPRLEDLKRYIVEHLENNKEVNLSSFSTKINGIYKNAKYKTALTFSNTAELIAKLNSPEESALTSKSTYMLLDLELISYDIETVNEILEENILIKSSWDKYVGKQHLPETLQESKTISVLFQYVLYKYLLAVLDNNVRVISKKGDGIIQKMLNNELSPQAIIENPNLIKENENDFNYAGFNEYISKNHGEEKVIIINFCKEDHFLKFENNKEVAYIKGRLNKKDRFVLYESVLRADKNPLKTKNPSVFLHDFHLPIYKMKRFWPKNTMPVISAEKDAVEKKELVEKQKKTNQYSLLELQSKIKAIWKTILEIEDEINENDDFFNLGGDSLTGLDMLAELEKEFRKAYINYEEIFSFSTVKKIAEVLFERMNELVVLEKSDEKKFIKPQKIRQEEYDSLINEIQKSEVPKKIDCKNVLITGATGQVGSYLAKELLETTDFNIICLVRGADIKQANDRFWKVFEKNFNINNHGRIKVVVGDLSQKDLMLNAEGISLLKELDAVYHVAGTPSFVGKPNLEEHINYLGTKNIFDWSVSNSVKYFNYVSTIGIVGKSMPEEIKAFYETDLNLGQDTTHFIHMGSKLMAEGYIRNNESSIKTNVFRLSNVGGDYVNGVLQGDMNKNLMYLKLLTLSKIASYSDEFLKAEANIKLIPVDVLARVICQLSLVENQILDTFHLNYENEFTIENVINAFETNKVYFTKLDDETFRDYIEETKKDSKDFTIGHNKYGAYDKNENDFVVFSAATREYLNKLQLTIQYDREKYLGNIIKEGMKNQFFTFEENLIIE
ncbi:beta-ketoacyl synthase N-terminal-like domain-containing protein [Flavobacterium sp. FlaQc-52]|uniref:beta-ketoacyl synthase N-terminal-like domain-containing protein n=1 Tax=Flavobacterium sp. FlaQc-52 TaxID=3374185 RepID=UPI003757E151